MHGTRYKCNLTR